jgi:hypothetical protein
MLTRKVEEEIVEIYSCLTDLPVLPLYPLCLLPCPLCVARRSHVLSSQYHTVPISTKPKSHVLVAGCHKGKVMDWKGEETSYTRQFRRLSDPIYIFSIRSLGYEEKTPRLTSHDISAESSKYLLDRSSTSTLLLRKRQHDSKNNLYTSLTEIRMTSEEKDEARE